MGNQKGVMIQTMDLTEGVTTHSREAEVMGGVDGREPHSFPGNLQDAPHLQEETVQMDRVNAVHGTQTRQGFPGRATNQGGLEEALGLKSICPPLKMKRPRTQ